MKEAAHWYGYSLRACFLVTTQLCLLEALREVTSFICIERHANGHHVNRRWERTAYCGAGPRNRECLLVGDGYRLSRRSLIVVPDSVRRETG